MRKRFIILWCAFFLVTAHSWGQTYYAGDVAVINRMIAEHGLVASANSPSTWRSFVEWTIVGNAYRITSLGRFVSNLTGNLNLTELTELQYLNIRENKLTSLNVSDLKKLVSLECEGNQLSLLKANGCSALEYLKCNYNRLSSLEISDCSALKTLDCSLNKLTSLNVAGYKNLSDLSCQSNLLTSLDVSGCTSLDMLECNNNQLTSLIVKGCSKLRLLYCENNSLTSIDLSGITNKSVTLRCDPNPLTKLVVQDGASIDVAASPKAAGTVKITGLRGSRVYLRATANTGYVFYDWTLTIPTGSQNFALPASTDIGLSGGSEANATLTANFTGATGQ